MLDDISFLKGPGVQESKPKVSNSLQLKKKSARHIRSLKKEDFNVDYKLFMHICCFSKEQLGGANTFL